MRNWVKKLMFLKVMAIDDVSLSFLRQDLNIPARNCLNISCRAVWQFETSSPLEAPSFPDFRWLWGKCYVFSLNHRHFTNILVPWTHCLYFGNKITITFEKLYIQYSQQFVGSSHRQEILIQFPTAVSTWDRWVSCGRRRCRRRRWWPDARPRP